MRVGSPQGLNPFGETMSPDQRARAGAPVWGDPAAFAATAPPPTTGEPAGGASGAAQPYPGQAGGPGAAAGPPMPEQAGGAAEPYPGPPMARPAEPSVQTSSQAPPPEEATDAPRTLAGFLVSYEGDELGIFWPLYQGRNLVGRKDAVAGLDIEIDHPTTSSRHAILFAQARPGRVQIEDPGSTNGTFINDVRLETGTKRELRDGDRVRFGGFVTTVKVI